MNPDDDDRRKSDSAIGGGKGHALVAEAIGPFPDARVLLDRYGLRAKKQFGQNFLVSERALRAITDAAVTTDMDWIVEIGPGLGTLTARIVERVTAGKVIALEQDPDMIRVLQAELGEVDNLEIQHVDAMKYDLRMVHRMIGEPITVCGNLPYHLASQLMFKVIDARDIVRFAVFMIQKEMADRLVAKPGTKEYGALGVMIRTYCDVTTVIKVGAGSFVPAPKIDSTVIKMTPLPGGEPRVPIADHKHYSKVVHTAFGQRRKTLRNALRAAWPDDQIDAALAATKIDGIRRGETLSIDEFGQLTAALPPAVAAG
jgi:16S rRNA (adenine1518-N6/adenine1519-N6)-dimethyltransferase